VNTIGARRTALSGGVSAAVKRGVLRRRRPDGRNGSGPPRLGVRAKSDVLGQFDIICHSE